MSHRVPSIAGGSRVVTTLAPGLALCLAIWLAAVSVLLPASAAMAQSAPAPADQQPAPGQEALKPNKFLEAQRLLNGPAGNPECVDLGTKALFRLQGDDIDTAFRHLDLYDRFGCPGGHIQAAYRCLLLHPLTPDKKPTDPKASDTLEDTVDACWINPALPVKATSASAPAAPATAAAPSPNTSH